MWRRLPGRGLVLALTLLLPSVAAAQGVGVPRGDMIRIQGEVLDGLTGLPLKDVMVVIHDLWSFTRTDELGYFSFETMPAGEHELGVYALGYSTIEQVVDFSFPEDVFAVHLQPAPIEIEGLQVDLYSQESLEYRSFGQRYDYVGPELMREYREKYSVITDMIRARFPAVRVVDFGGAAVGGSGFCILTTRRSSSPSEAGGGCAALFIDGLQATADQVRSLHPEEIESIRYLDRLEARLIYGGLGSYGALLVETRRGGR